MMFIDYRDTEVVFAWVKRMRIPTLPKGDVVNWDNVAFHKSLRILEAFIHAEIRLLFLAAYGPDLNLLNNFGQG